MEGKLMISQSQSWIIPAEEIEIANRLDAKFFHPDRLSVLKKLKNYGHFKSLGELCKKGFPSRGDAPYKPKYIAYGIPVLVTDSLTGKRIDWEKVEYVPDEVFKKSKWKIKENDILIASTGMGSIAKVDIISFIPEEFKGKCLATPKLTIVRTDKEEIDNYYLWIYLRSHFGQVQMLTSVRGQTGQLELYPQDIGNILVPLLPLSIQKQISSKAKEAMSLEMKIFKLKKELLKYEGLIFHKADRLPQTVIIRELQERFDVKFYFGKELVRTHSKFDCKVLSSLLREPIHAGYTPSRYAYGKKGIPIVKVRHLTNEGINWNEISFVSEEFYKKKKARLQNNDVLIVSSAHSPEGIAEKVDVVEIPPKFNKCLAVAELLIIRVNTEQINPHYLAWILRSNIMKNQIKRFTRGESGHIYGKDMQHLLIPYPPKDMQDEIGEKCRKISELRMKFFHLLKEAEVNMDRVLYETFYR